MLGKMIAASMLIAGVVHGASLPKGPVQRVLFVDESISPLTADLERWGQAAESGVFAPMHFGDAVLVFGVHDHTADSAPIFDASVPAFNPGAGMDVVLDARKKLRRAREDGAAAVRAALRSPVRSRSTRLVESLGRIPHDVSRATEVMYLSDMLESTHELDLERTPITDANVSRLVQLAVDRYHLRRGALSGVKIRVVLDSPAVGVSRPVANDHSSLERFWRLLFTSLGGTLVSFDSRVQ